MKTCKELTEHGELLLAELRVLSIPLAVNATSDAEGGWEVHP